MKKYKILTLISSLIACGLTIGTVFAAWAVTDNANPLGIKITLDSGASEREIYLDASTTWSQYDPAIFIHAWGGSGSQDVLMEKCDSEHFANYYKGTIKDDHTNLLFVRDKTGTKTITYSGDDFWGKTEDLTIPTDDKDTYQIHGWADEQSKWIAHECYASNTVTENEVEPTCETAGGYDTVKYCELCGKDFVREHTTIDALGHQYEFIYSWGDGNKSCTANGVCSRDIEHKLDEVTTTITSQTLIEATCHSLGKARLTATFLNPLIPAAVKEVDIPMTEHNWSPTYSFDETYHWIKCLNDGCTEIKNIGEHIEGTPADEQHGAICSVCHNEYTEPIGHVHNLEHVNAVEETCTTDGNYEYWHCTKQNCDKYYLDAEATQLVDPSDLIIPKHHTLVEHPETDSTCTQQGNYAYWSCSKCGKYFSDSHATNEISEGSCLKPLATHSYDDAWHSDATGHWHECSVCGRKDNVLPHDWDNGVITTEPTTTSYGVKTYTCTTCYTTKTEQVPMLDVIKVYFEESNTDRGQASGYDWQGQMSDVGNGWYYAVWDLGNANRYIRVRVETYNNGTLKSTTYPHNSGYYWGIGGSTHTTGAVAFNIKNQSASWTLSSQWDQYGQIRYVQKIN